MSVLKNITKTLKTAGQGVSTVSSGMMKVASGIAKTASKVGTFITGGKREQTYGYTSQFFPMRNKKYKSQVKIAPITPKLSSISTIPVAPTGHADTGDLSGILNYMKRMHEQNTTRLEVQNSFMEERRNEEENRHKELLAAFQKFTSIETPTATRVVETKKEEGGNVILDVFKNMLDSAVKNVLSVVNGIIDGVKKSFEWLNDLKTFIKPAMKFFVSPLFRALLNPYVLGFASMLALAKYLAKIMPDYSEVTPEEAKNVLELGSERDIEALGGREKLQKIIADANEAGAQITVTPQTVTQLGDVPPRPDTSGGKNMAIARNWDNKFSKTHNPDGTPKVQTQAKPLTSGVEESTAGGGRGTAALTDYNARMLEEETGGKAAFGVKPQGIKSVPLPPTPSPISNLIDENRNLEDQVSVSQTVAPPIVSVNGSSSVVNTPPIPSTASWRDDEPMVERVLQKTRSYV